MPPSTLCTKVKVASRFIPTDLSKMLTGSSVKEFAMKLVYYALPLNCNLILSLSYVLSSVGEGVVNFCLYLMYTDNLISSKITLPGETKPHCEMLYPSTHGILST